MEQGGNFRSTEQENNERRGGQENAGDENGGGSAGGNTTGRSKTCDCQSAPLECHRRTHPIVAAHIIV